MSLAITVYSDWWQFTLEIRILLERRKSYSCVEVMLSNTVQKCVFFSWNFRKSYSTEETFLTSCCLIYMFIYLFCFSSSVKVRFRLIWAKSPSSSQTLDCIIRPLRDLYIFQCYFLYFDWHVFKLFTETLRLWGDFTGAIILV